MSKHTLKAVSTAHPKPKTTDVIGNYTDIRNKFLTQSNQSTASGNSNQALSNSQGFSWSNASLGTRVGGLDKLFYTLVQGIVDDPDYAIKKDSKIYRRMERDPQIFYCLQVRKIATAALPWVIKTPPGFENDAQATHLASEAEKRIRQIPRPCELFTNILSALLPGLSVSELVWKLNSNGRYIVGAHFPMNKDRFKFSIDGQLRLLTKRSPYKGMALPDYKFIRHTFNATDGSWKDPADAGYIYFGRGLADTPLYHYFYFKLTALRFLMYALERYGNPSKILYTGSQNTKLASRLYEIMTALKNDSVVAIPGSAQDVKVDIIKPIPSRVLFMEFMKYVDSLVTKTILGQELMTEVSMPYGSYAAAKVHKGVFHQIVEMDRKSLVATLNTTLMRFDAELNTPNVPIELRPIFAFKSAALENATEFLSLVKGAVELGLTVSEAQIRELTGLREPLEHEAILTPPSPEPLETSNQNQNQNQLKDKGQKNATIPSSHATKIIAQSSKTNARSLRTAVRRKP